MIITAPRGLAYYFLTSTHAAGSQPLRARYGLPLLPLVSHTRRRLTSHDRRAAYGGHWFHDSHDGCRRRHLFHAQLDAATASTRDAQACALIMRRSHRADRYCAIIPSITPRRHIAAVADIVEQRHWRAHMQTSPILEAATIYIAISSFSFHAKSAPYRRHHDFSVIFAQAIHAKGERMSFFSHADCH